jgi:hypothetical protein
VRKPLIGLAVAGFIALTACTSQEAPPEPFNVSTIEKAQEAPCDRVNDALTEVKKINASDDSQLRRSGLEAWQIDTESTKDEVNELISALETRAKSETCKSGSNKDADPAPEFTADQEVALRDCVKEEERKNFKPSSNLDSKLLKACKATGKALFDGLDDRVRGDAKVGNSPANAAASLAKTKELHEAPFYVRVLAIVNENTSKGVISDTVSTADQVKAAFPGVTQEEVNIGSHNVDFAANQNPAGGSNSFTDTGDEQFESTKEIADYFASGTPEAKAGFASVAQAIKGAGYGDDEVARAEDGSGYIPIQFKDATQVLGTSYFKDGKVFILGKWRQAKPGDIYWLFLTKDGKLILGATLRGKCYNPGITQVVVVRPGMPSAPPVEQPPGKETCPSGITPNPETGLCNPPDECPEPGIQPPGHPCSKAGQSGSIEQGNHDPQGGKPGPDNTTEPTPNNDEPVIPNRDQPGSSGGSGGSTGAPNVNPSPNPNPPTEDTGDDDNDGVLPGPSDPPPPDCDPRFYDCP